MVEKIDDGVYKVVGHSNVYIIMKPEVYVIDTSNNMHRKDIGKEIESVVPLRDVKKVLLTHLHYDHCGNVDLFLNAGVYASKEELENFRESPNDFFVQGISEKGKNMVLNATELPNEINGLKVISVPGHTKGSVAFLDEKRKVLYSGDTLFLNGVGRTDFVNSVPKEMDSSVDRLKGLVEGGYKLCAEHDY